MKEGPPMPDCQPVTYLDARGFKRASGEADDPSLALRKTLTPRGQVVDRDALTLRFTLSTESVDRDSDRVAVEGWQLDNYRRNPVVLWAHDHSQPPVARSQTIGVEVDGLVAQARFTPKDLYPFGYMTFQLYAEGFLNAVSVGFRPLAWRWSEEEGRERGIDFLHQELLEFSCVPVPANPDTLVRARAKGIDTAPLVDWVAELLDGKRGEGLVLPRKTLERLHRAARGQAPVTYQMSRAAQDNLVAENLQRIKAQSSAARAPSSPSGGPGDVADVGAPAETPTCRAQDDEAPHLAEFCGRLRVIERRLARLPDATQPAAELRPAMSPEQFRSLVEERVGRAVRAITGRLD
jgi:HK97 family phage prohead protease